MVVIFDQFSTPLALTDFIHYLVISEELLVVHLAIDSRPFATNSVQYYLILINKSDQYASSSGHFIPPKLENCRAKFVICDAKSTSHLKLNPLSKLLEFQISINTCSFEFVNILLWTLISLSEFNVKRVLL